MQFHIENMTCDGCARSVAKAIHAVDAAATVSADVTRRTLDVTSEKPRALLETVLATAGYPASASRTTNRAGGCCRG